MKRSKLTWSVVFAGFALIAACAAGGGSTDPIEAVKTAAGEMSFSQTVQPILLDHCIRCHGEDEDGGLNIESYERVMQGGRSGDFVIPGDPDGSRLITSVEKTRPPHMPPKVFPALTEDRIQAIRAWIAEGAKDN
jgi:mono/diheme cytochrome c family protein